MRAAILLALALLAAAPAHASWGAHHWRHHGHGWSQGWLGSDARPSAWCGWFMRRQLGVSDRSYNLARNWAHWGHATAPHSGAVVVWPHHVGQIRSDRPDARGRWLILSGNDGNAVRERWRSLAKAIAVRI